MKCRFCGKKIKNGETICRKCGKEVTEDINTEELIDAMPELHDEFDSITKMQIKDKKKKEKKKKREEQKVVRIVLAIVLVIVILAGVAGGMYYHKRKAEIDLEKQQTVKTSAIDAVLKKSFIAGGFGDLVVTDETTARAVIESQKEVFGILDVNSEFKLEREIKVGNETFYRFNQVYGDIAVYGGKMIVMADKDGNVIGLNGVYVPVIGLVAAYKIDKGSASAAMTEYINSLSDYAVVAGINISEIEKAICNVEDKTYLAYKSNISGYNSSSKYIAYDVFIDGVTGDGICVSVTSSFENESSITDEEIENSYIYEIVTASDKFNWNDETIAMAEEPISIDDITSGLASAYVTSVKNSVDKAYNYFDKTFAFKGLNGLGGSFKVYINSNDYVQEDLPVEKAMHTNNKIMFFREDLTQGDIDYNTVVHEYAHGVMRNIAGFRGTMELSENSAISEGLADVFAELAEASDKKEAPDWIHGERNILKPLEGYYTYIPADVKIESVDECYRYSTIVSHTAAKISQQVESVSTQNEFWFKALCFMTESTDFSELSSILNVVASNMYQQGKLDDTQYNHIAESIKMLDIVK